MELEEKCLLVLILWMLLMEDLSTIMDLFLIEMFLISLQIAIVLELFLTILEHTQVGILLQAEIHTLHILQDLLLQAEIPILHIRQDLLQAEIHTLHILQDLLLAEIPIRLAEIPTLQAEIHILQADIHLQVGIHIPLDLIQLHHIQLNIHQLQEWKIDK